MDDLRRQCNRIDWQLPWFAPYAQLGRALVQALQQQGTVAAALNQVAAELTAYHPAALPCSVRFVPQACMPRAAAYESFIYSTRSVPTRDNAHDFFNGLIWLHYPQTKWWLNGQQAMVLAQLGQSAPRGPLRDTLTLFDENALLFAASPAAQQLLRHKQWLQLLSTERAAFLDGRYRCRIFGHALLEKMLQPWKSVCAHVLTMPRPTQTDVHSLDTQTAGQLRTYLAHGTLTPQQLCSLPVLGIPLWHSDNHQADFYADPHVFRPPKPDAHLSI